MIFCNYESYEYSITYQRIFRKIRLKNRMCTRFFIADWKYDELENTLKIYLAKIQFEIQNQDKMLEIWGIIATKSQFKLNKSPFMNPTRSKMFAKGFLSLKDV